MSTHARHPAAVESTAALLRELLPRFYWLRDAEARGALEALVAALAVEYEQLRDEVEGLYDDLFIETCAPEIVPYIGEGIGVTGLGPVRGPGVGDRAWVGRTIGFRRRKGTLAAAARAAAAATGWAVYVQEGSAVTGHTQSVVYPEPRSGRLADMVDTESLAAPDAPWSTLTRWASVAGRPVTAGEPAARQPAPRAGYPAPLTVAAAAWRLEPFPVVGRTPAAAAETGGRGFRFNPAGVDAPLFAAPRSEGDATLPPARAELPLPLTTASLREALRSARSPLDAPVVVWRPADSGRREPFELAADDLADWRSAADAEAVVDPVRGRLLFRRPPPDDVQVDYAYGFSGALGGGPYGHASSYAPLGPHTRVLHVTRSAASGPGVAAAYGSLEAALAAAAEAPPRSDCLVLIEDSATYTAPDGAWRIVLSDGRSVRIVSTPAAAPVLAGSLEVHADAGSRLELSGLMVLGRLAIGGDGEVAAEHCTLVPGDDVSVTVTGRSAAALSLSYSVVGRVDPGGAARVGVENAIVDGRGGDALGSERRPAGELDLRQVTVLGATTARTIVAENSIFAERLTASGAEPGLITASFVAGGSRPGTVLASASADTANVRPRFTSTRWGDPGYGQLDLRCPAEIACGAELNGEMGAFNWLRQPTRFARLPIVLGEMLPAGVSASVEYRN